MKKVTLLGDSIRLFGYGTVIAKYLPNIEIFQPEDNCRFCTYTLRMIKDVEEELKTSDVITWNNGIWDSSTVCDDGKPLIPLKEYLNCMSRIGDSLLRKCKKIVFVTSTPLRKDIELNQNCYIDLYNKKLTKILKKKGIKIFDLHAVIAKDVDKYIKDDMVHLSDEGMDEAAKQLSKFILENF